MKIALYGATGNIGRRILDEALRRGHSVTAIVRDASRLDVVNDHLTVATGDATDVAGVAANVAGNDVVIGSISGRRDGSAQLIVDAANALIAGTQQAGVHRLLWVGGAGSLETAPGVRVMDSPEFPAMYLPEAKAGAEILAILRTLPDGLDWSYLSPAAEIAPGERTGVFRLGGDQFFTAADGHSRISMEDYAVALLDEVENPTHTRQRFSIAY